MLGIQIHNIEINTAVFKHHKCAIIRLEAKYMKAESNHKLTQTDAERIISGSVENLLLFPSVLDCFHA